MAKITLNNLTTNFGSQTLHNENSQTIEDALNDKVLWRDNPTGEPNQMEGQLDMNSNRVINVADGELPQDAITKAQLDAASALTTIAASTSTYTGQGTGALARTIASRFDDVVSVKNFGAVGNGSTDDTAAIQAALDAHSHVFFPSGDYVITSVLELPAGRSTSLSGAGREFSRLVAGGNIADATGALIKMGSTADVSLGNGTETISFAYIGLDCLSGTYASNLYGVNINTAKNCIVDTCASVNSLTRGFMFQSCVGTINVTNTLLKDTGVQGVYSKGGNQAVLISGCTFDNTGTGSPAYLEDGRVAVRDSVFIDCDQGPQIRKSSGSSNLDVMGEISGCLVLNPTGNGIVVGNSMQRFIITNNTVLRNDASLTNEFAYNIDITQPGSVDCHGIVSNNIAIAINGASYDDGLRFTGVQHCIVSDNHIVGTERYGIYTDSLCDNFNVTGNTLEAYTGDGCNFNSNNNVVKNNVFNPASTGQDYVRFVAGTTGNVFSNNVCYSVGNVATSNSTTTYVEDNIFPDKASTDSVYQFNTRPEIKNEVVFESTNDITLAGAVFDQVVLDTTSGNKTITLGDIDTLGKGQGFYIHKTVAANSLTLTADTSEEVDDGTTNGNSVALFADTETGLAKVISGASAGTNVWYVVDKIIR